MLCELLPGFSFFLNQDSSDDEDVEECSGSGKEGEEKRGDGKISTSAEDKKEVEEEEEEEEAVVQDTFSAHVVIHQALHLPEMR